MAGGDEALAPGGRGVAAEGTGARVGRGRAGVRPGPPHRPPWPPVDRPRPRGRRRRVRAGGRGGLGGVGKRRARLEDGPRLPPLARPADVPLLSAGAMGGTGLRGAPAGGSSRSAMPPPADGHELCARCGVCGRPWDPVHALAVDGPQADARREGVPGGAGPEIGRALGTGHGLGPLDPALGGGGDAGCPPGEGVAVRAAVGAGPSRGPAACAAERMGALADRTRPGGVVRLPALSRGVPPGRPVARTGAAGRERAAAQCFPGDRSGRYTCRPFA